MLDSGPHGPSMIAMQRSLSSPVCIRSSPPVSPTAPRPPSRSPSPSPKSRADTTTATATATRTRGLRSRSPVHSAPPPESTASLPLRRSEDTPRDGATHHQRGASASKRPVIAQAPARSNASPSRSPPAPSSPLRPALKDEGFARPQLRSLLTDSSLYTNPHLTVEDEGTTLQELAHLVRLSKYQERKRANTRIRLQRTLVSTALSARLTRCGEATQRNLAESFRSSDTQGFANLFSAMQDVRNSCDATRRYALLEPEMESLQSPGMASPESLDVPPSTIGGNGLSLVTPFLGELSVSARETILNFLTQLRTNPDYLASRLCALTDAELQALTMFHRGLEPIESQMPFHEIRSSGRGGASTANRNSAVAPNPVERLLSFQRHDPLSALIHTCFANSAGPDSAEDKRRTEIWASACARLISSKSHHNTLISILNVWSAMRDWSGRSNMEWFLMKILEEGAFLLDRAEDPQGTRFHISDWSSKDSIAAEEFYDRAVDELFDIIDDEDATGIPEGVIELGNEILRQLGDKFVDETRSWFVYKWLFSSWLMAVVIHPESYGMMAEYNITEYGRQKILKAVAQRASALVVDMLWPHNSHPVSTPLKVKGHIKNLVARFGPSKKQRTARLLPARSITSLRETVEVHPYLVISPADLVTLVNALFPERRPQSAHSSSIRSGAPSISGFSAISQPISIATSRSNAETASVISTSTSSILSDATTSHEPLLESHITGTTRRYSPTVPDTASQKRLSNYEEDGHLLRSAMQEMAHVLGADVVAGSCHPCAEQWAVVFVASDGKSLSLHMTYDPDDELAEENSSTTSDSEDDEPDDKPELDKDYHQLRDSILRLVEDFEIPQGLENSETHTTFSNRASGLKKYRSKNKVITPERSMGSRNPYRKREEEEKAKQSPESPSHALGGGESASVLITMLNAASSQSRVQSDFVSAHLYWRTLQQLNTLTSPSLRQNGFASLLNIFSRGPRDSIRRSASAIEEYDAWLVWLKQSQERHEGLIETMMKRLRAFRDKMWYVTDVRNSDVYEHARNFCSALKIMGVSRKWESLQRSRAQLARSSALSYIHLQESQMLGLLAASDEQGGPNKLSDDQAEKTKKWLEQFSVHNWCDGEERIHRFCCEMHTCMDKLVGDSVTANPVLWSSPLFLRDRKTFEGPRKGRDRDSIFGGDDAASVISADHDRRYTSSSNRPNSIVRDLRNMSSHNMSQISLSSGRHSFSRASTVMSDVMDPRDYFGVSSPVHTIDSASTYWSPFQSTMSNVSSATSRAQSPTASVTNLSGSSSQPYRHRLPSSHSIARPRTSTSSDETVHIQRLSDEKQRFLSDLRQTLLGLVLSDLGNFVFARGSETDAWFNDLGQDCIEHREAAERSAGRTPGKREKTSTGHTKQRVIGKKKSSGNLREAGDSNASGRSTGRHRSPSGPSNASSATNETVSAHTLPPRKDESSEFPYKKAYQRLLKMFSVHPSPYSKLNTLFELEQLIIASLSTGGRRSRWNPRSPFAPSDDSDRSNSQEQSSRERRPTAFQPSLVPGLYSRSTANADTRSIVSVSLANKDAIRNVLKALFRDAGVRPQTLFRDLQFISAFVSPSVLDTERNAAYWDIGIAAASLKQSIVTTMVEIADEAVASSRKRSSGTDNATETPPPSHSLHDAARMLTIAAKEGDPTAQRELGLFQLSNPELVARATLPLSKPREIFKQTVMENFGARPGSSARHPADRARAGLGMAVPNPTTFQDAGNHGNVRDPALMCVAFHWMEAAENGGDELARRFLRQNNEMMGLG
ncbi:Uu.00g006830.m01.CDS01 [Anthostomella pinea]|uniref:Uu.00g006830.m01.CDS01 n=1 Tax=Anthostomella pinea TaxID=933095 RepID=A0AAI8VKH6_9PEZI|nr:Uu.00g006830.m01.CDS01 [Anthostomella pinea]